MSRRLTKFPLICLSCFLFPGLLVLPAAGQEPKVDNIAKDLGKQIAK